MTTGTRVSVIIPVFNGARYLGETIEDALKQSHPLHELIVVDDGSTDDSAEVARSFGDRVTYVYQQNAGHAAARNNGVGKSTGDFIAFQDADDLWREDKNALQVDAFRRDPELMICVAHVENFASPDVPAELQLPTFGPRTKPMAGYVSTALMVRRQAFDVLGLFDVTLKHADTQQWFKKARAMGVRELLLPDVLAMRRLHESNRSRLFADESRDEYLHLLKMAVNSRRVPSAPVTPS